MTSNAGDKFPDRNLGAAEKWGRTIEDRIAGLESSGNVPAKAANDAQVSALAGIIAQQWSPEIQAAMEEFDGAITWAPYPPTSDDNSEDPDDEDIIPPEDPVEEDPTPLPDLILRTLAEYKIVDEDGEGPEGAYSTDTFLGPLYALSRDDHLVTLRGDEWSDLGPVEGDHLQVVDGLIHLVQKDNAELSIFNLDGDEQDSVTLPSGGSVDGFTIIDNYLYALQGSTVHVIERFAWVQTEQWPVPGAKAIASHDYNIFILSDSGVSVRDQSGEENASWSASGDLIGADDFAVYVVGSAGVTAFTYTGDSINTMSLSSTVSDIRVKSTDEIYLSTPDSVLRLRLSYEDAPNGTFPDPDPIPMPDPIPTETLVDPEPVYQSWLVVDEEGNIDSEWQFVDGLWEPRPSGGGRIAVGAITETKIADDSITTPKIVANAIVGDKIAANTIGAEKILTETLGADEGFINVLNSATIIGAIIKTAADGKRVELDSENGIRIFNEEGEGVLWADNTGNLILGGDISLTGTIRAESTSSRVEISPGEIRVSPKNMLEQIGDTSLSPVMGDFQVLPNHTPDGYAYVYDVRTSSTVIRRYNIKTGLRSGVDVSLPYVVRPGFASGGYAYFVREPDSNGAQAVIRVQPSSGASTTAVTLEQSGVAGEVHFLRGRFSDGGFLGVNVSDETESAQIYTSSGFVSNVWDYYDGVRFSETYFFVDDSNNVFILAGTLDKRSRAGTLLARGLVPGQGLFPSITRDVMYVYDWPVGVIRGVAVSDLTEVSGWGMGTAFNALYFDPSSGVNGEAWVITAGTTPVSRKFQLQMSGSEQDNITISATGIWSPYRVSTPVISVDRVEGYTGPVEFARAITASGINIFDSLSEADSALPPGVWDGVRAYIREDSSNARYHEWQHIRGDWYREDAAREIATPGVDLNDFIQPGTYKDSSTGSISRSNYPPDAGGRGTLVVVSSGESNSIVEQTFTTTGTTTTPGKRFYRTRNTISSGWSPWALIAGGQDSGWVNLTSYRVSGSDSVWLEGRKVGDDITIRGQVERSGGFATGNNIMNALPVMWRPANNTQGPAWFSGSVSGIVWIRPDGTVAVAHAGTSNRGSVQFTLRYWQ